MSFLVDLCFFFFLMFINVSEIDQKRVKPEH